VCGDCNGKFAMSIQVCEQEIAANPKTWLVTGVAGFIGSNLLERLLRLDQRVVGLDNLSTGYRQNLESVRLQVSPVQWQRFRFMEGDIRSLTICRAAVESADYVLHQAAMGSVPRSLLDPIATHEHNVNGFLNMLVASRDAQVRRFIYASSSSVYGDHPGLPKMEDAIGHPLSPYAVTKQVDELYASVFARCFAMQVIGLRYFNIFGPRQDLEGAYAAVIPLWFKALLKNEPAYIYGDGCTSRDFCYVDNAVQANLLAAWIADERAVGRTYNVAVGEQTTLLQLFEMIQAEVQRQVPTTKTAEPQFRDFRPGDIRYSLADISMSSNLLGYKPTHSVSEGVKLASIYYIQNVCGAQQRSAQA
jgi:UDP-N-acetylglucosamine/UDP-N-acetyl-alpha-D-glucosaminouronate 4-epimerase